MIPDSLCSPKQSTALSHAITHVISMRTKKQTPLHSLGGSRVAKEASCRWALSFPEALLLPGNATSPLSAGSLSLGEGACAIPGELMGIWDCLRC